MLQIRHSKGLNEMGRVIQWVKAKKRKLAQAMENAEAMVSATIGGKHQVKFDHPGNATMLGQFPFYI